MTASFTTRALTSADLPQLAEIQRAYAAAHPPRTPVATPIYVSPYFDHGQNVLCAFDGSGCLLGAAPYLPQNDLAWVEIETLPGADRAVRDTLFAWLVDRARQGGQTRLNFQYFPSEEERIGYVVGKGAQNVYSIFNMQRDLAHPIPAIAMPAGFTLRHWRMESEDEQRAYLAARNECFPEAPTNLEEWQFFASAPHWVEGINIAAFSGETLAASVLVYWDPGNPAGSTEFVFTIPAYRGKGLVRALLAEALRYLKARGLSMATLEVKAENEKALSAYFDLDYHVVAESRVYQVTT